MYKRTLLALLSLLVLCTGILWLAAACAGPVQPRLSASAQSPKPSKTPKPTITPKQTSTPKPTIAPQPEAWPNLPPLDKDGYLAADCGQEEFFHADEANGLWLYISKDLQVQIQRYSDPNKPLIWYESVIRCRGDQCLDGVLTNPGNPGTKLRRPDVIAKSNRLVFAVSDDYFGDRKYNGIIEGIIVRNGKIVSQKTYKNDSTAFPNLETMALFQDGSLRVYKSREYTAQEYIDMGATDVFAFGPILIRDGIINDKLNKRHDHLEPRCAFGMVEPNHYVCIVVEGRHDKSRGTGLPWVARRMAEMGVTQALNLDGGQTVALTFMGGKINTTGKFGPAANVRSLSGMIGIGVSQMVPEK